jgi:hypothetical protein
MGMTPDWKDKESPIRLHLLYATKHEFKLDAQKQAALKELVLEELKQGVIRVIHHNAVMMYNPIVPVRKSGSQRKITDCRHLNSEQKDMYFKMEGPEQLTLDAQKHENGGITAYGFSLRLHLLYATKREFRLVRSGMQLDRSLYQRN